MSVPSDQELTESGYVEDTPASVLIIGCGALAREIIAIRDELGLRHMALQCLPAILHNSPEKIPGAVEAAVRAAKDKFETIFVAYADCGTGGLLAAKCQELGVEMIAGPHCYSFFEGNTAFGERGDQDMQSFFLTDFLARQFEAFVIRPLGLDRHPELRDMYFGNYTTLVYQSQTEDAALLARAQNAAKTLGLKFEHRPTGYGDLKVALTKLA